MATLAPEDTTLSELDRQVKDAWDSYAESLKDLKGGEYVRVEEKSWDDLQQLLESIQQSRSELQNQ